MGFLIKLIDAVLLLFFLVMILAAPGFDAQVCFPSEFFPTFLIDLNLLFTSEYGDYLLIEKPSFSVGHMWLELLFQWPLANANLYAILVRGKPRFNSTCLVYGVSVFIGMLIFLLRCSRQNKMNAESLHWVGKRRLEMQHATKIWYNCLAFAELLMPVSI
ncbi:unnamed protein product [Camellia sinensis]